jgi:pimeloyl-ACP methyl ester carboxylesterase
MSTSEPLSILSADGQTSLEGQIDFPPGVLPEREVVLIVPGGWFMDRDGYMGGCEDERCLIYRELARALCAAGVTVARYDNRGVSCNEFTMPPCDASGEELQVTRHYLAHCIDPGVRRTITIATNVDDVESVYAYVARRFHLDEGQAVIVAHSEGGINVARLVGQGRIRPKGMVFVASIAESPKSVFMWQTIDRNVATLMSWDADRDGVVTRTDVERMYPADPFFSESAISMDELLPKSAWSEAALRDFFTARHLKMRRDALACDPRDPYPKPSGEFEVVNASYDWYRQWFEDDTPVIEHLRSYDGDVCFHLGEIDPQTPGHRQLALAPSGPTPGRVRFKLHKNRGHALRSGERLVGPMDPEARDEVVSDVLAVLRS